MTPVENIFVCMVAPMLMTLFILKDGARRFNLFFIIGMAVALSAGFINPLFAKLAHSSSLDMAIYIAPISEEILKALPILIYVLVFKPEKNDIIVAALAVGVGFATLENCTYITAYHNSELLFAILRGFASGIMHAVNTAVVGFGMCYAYNKKPDAIFTFGLLGAVITYHSIYNMLVTAPTNIRHIGWVLPMLTAAIITVIRHKDYVMQLIKRIFRIKSGDTSKIVNQNETEELE
ncbi:MAG: PrsW family glutamic-type intramembrane protease [Oscillospiraceae bacterium]|nr:PrsW family glutamic-type intramembrane protease [Oscillospiraceae bacterium]MDD4402496.1 PrsW family glutamic-type intramembrane protease [Desulfitobacteriaceae bacterium]